MELSYSNASVYRSCPKKYYWKYVRKLIPVAKAPALSLGGILHEGFDMFYKGASDREVYDSIKLAYEMEMQKEEVADQEYVLINKYTALGMWLNYPYKNLKEFDKIFSEEAFDVPLCDNVTLVGKVDGRLSWQGNCWVRELKTTGLSKRQFEGRCQMAGQGTGYVYGLKKKGYDVKGILYEYIKKPYLQKGVKENAETFGHRIMVDYKNRPNFYYCRHLSYRTPQDLDNFELDMTALANDILDKVTRNVFYRNVDQCWNYNTECEYAKICFAKDPDPLTLELYFVRKEEK